MKLPNSDAAFVDPAKLKDYLLAGFHPVGRFKASFFAALGYERTNWRELEADLIAVGRSNSAEPDQRSPFGRKFRVRGRVKGPNGREAAIVTVWIILNNEDFPRLITAFPGEAR